MLTVQFEWVELDEWGSHEHSMIKDFDNYTQLEMQLQSFYAAGADDVSYEVLHDDLMDAAGADDMPLDYFY